jgi:hypothetical protein
MTEELPLGDSDGIRLGLELNRQTIGWVAFTNARIITMNGDEVIENGTLVVRENRIEAVGAAGDVSIPRDAYVKDARAKPSCPAWWMHTPTSAISEVD